MAEAAAVVGALGAAVAVLAASRATLGAGVGLLLVAIAGLAAAGNQAEAVSDLLDSMAGIGALAAGTAVVGLGAAVFARWPLGVVPALLAVAPIRLPVVTDPDSPVLLAIAGTGGLGRLYPLYGLLAAAVVALLWRTLHPGSASARLRPTGRSWAGPGEPMAPLPRPLALPLATFAALIAASFLWSEDKPAATSDLLFLWLPFVLLFVVVARAPFGPRSPRTLGVVLVAIAAGFAAFAVAQAATERLLFFTVSLERANELGELFRVTSAFQDPNHLGRHLVLAIAVVLVTAWLTRLRLPTALGLLAVLGAGLWFTYSQSSLVTLAVVALAVGVAAARDRPRRLLAATAAVTLVAGAAGLAVLLAEGSADTVTSGRSTLVEHTAAVAARHPLVGVGVSGQPQATREQEAPDEPKLQNVSHTTPLTVAAELGVLGLLAFVALLAGTGQLLGDLARRDRPLALALGAVLLALLLHSLFYAGLFENPLTWGALGVAVAASTQGRTFGGPRTARGRRLALRS